MYMPPLSSSFFIDPTPNDIDEFADDEPSDMLYCHICKKNMRDGANFENHIKSRPHLIMCETIEESYLHKVELLRHAANIDKQLHAIKMHGHISAKRISECPSQKLMQPKCVECNWKFCTRSDYDTHLLAHHAVSKTAEECIQIDGSQLHGDDPSPSKRIKMTEERECQENDEKAETEEDVNDAANEDANEARGGEDLTGTKKQEEDEAASLYANVPNDVFYCHLCHERMWDAKTFEKHIIGRSHLIMLQNIDEGYHLKANIIRLKAKKIQLTEVTNRIKQCPQKYCGMCDLHYHCPSRVHRKSEGHVELKKLFYPNCRVCNIKFYNRFVYDTHCLSPEHLIQIAKKNIKVGDVEI